MLSAIAVIGHPSRLGGADTELDHQIHCWQAMGLIVHICPTGPLDANLKGLGGIFWTETACRVRVATAA